ncbi:tyrosine-type recombinase/integrase [uncultured Fibrobacter sp.]|uniref:tyrosine-type recombinase/integrase n=1 Tax=uncultured Fibrobacter sp. TaxID=261512 RepID=UPI0026372296|nr:tyrosine-type recombinase/integrase [uncultured Fibrobacter sp.]
MNLSEHIEQFLQYLAERRRFSPRTVDTYKKSLAKFMEHLRASNSSNDNAANLELSAFAEMNVKSFVWDMKMKQKLAPTSICEHLAALKSFGKYLVKSKIIEKNPSENVPMPKRPKRLVNILGQKDLTEEKFPEIENPTLQQVRARILLELIYGSGLRISECQMLTWDRIDANAKLVRVLGKGNKERHVPISPYLRKVMLKYERMRDYYFDDKQVHYDNYLLSRTGRPLTKEALEHIFNQANQKASVRENIRCSPHTARHYFAQTCLRNGLDVYSVSRLLGHENINITKRYLQSLEDRSIVEMASQSTPLFNLRL